MANAKKNFCAIQCGYGPEQEGRYITFSCEATDMTYCKCRHSFGYVMPMKEGDRCMVRDGCECGSFQARLEAMAGMRRNINDLQHEMKIEMDN